MTAKPPFLPSLAFLALWSGLGVLCGLIVFLSYSALAHPTNFGLRQYQLETAIKTLRRKEAAILPVPIYAKGAICRTDPAKAAEGLKAQLASIGAMGGATLQGLYVAPENPHPNAPNFTPVVFQMDTQGTYEAAIATLSELSRRNPIIFADKVSLKSSLTSVQLHVKGEILCWTQG